MTSLVEGGRLRGEPWQPCESIESTSDNVLHPVYTSVIRKAPNDSCRIRTVRSFRHIQPL